MKKFKNLLAIAMVFVMLVAVMPINVFADGEGDAAVGIDPAVQNNPVDPVDQNDQDQPVEIKVTLNKNGHGDNVEIWVRNGQPIGDQAPILDDDGNFKFDGWYLDPEGNNICDLNAPVTQNLILYAKWVDQTQQVPEHEITIDDQIKNGSVTVRPNKAKAGETVELRIDPESGYELESLTVTDANNTPITLNDVSDSSKTFTMPAADVKVTATFKQITAPKPPVVTDDYHVFLDNPAHGSISSNKFTFKKGEKVTITASANPGYVIDRIYYINRNTKEKYNIKDYYYGGYRYNGYYRYDDDYRYRRFNGYYNDYYRYYNDYYDNYFGIYNSYDDYLYYEQRSHYRDYYDYRYDYDYRYLYNSYSYDKVDFYMPASDVDVYVVFRDWSYYDDYYYYGRYYDDYYYSSRKNKKNNTKTEEKEEEKKVEEKAPEVYETKAIITIGSMILERIRNKVHTIHQMDTAAYVKDGRAMLPIRYVAEALGLSVSWDAQTKTVHIWDLTQRVEIPVKSNRIIVNGITYTSDVKPEIKSSRTMLPIANIARALGLIDGSDIIWDQYNKQVTLTRKVLSK